MGVGQRAPSGRSASGLAQPNNTVMHAGVNRAPAIGRLASDEILDGVSVSLLDACRPARFLDRSTSTFRARESAGN
jgi:hypothetical protein